MPPSTLSVFADHRVLHGMDHLVPDKPSLQASANRSHHVHRITQGRHHAEQFRPIIIITKREEVSVVNFVQDRTTGYFIGGPYVPALCRRPLCVQRTEQYRRYDSTVTEDNGENKR